MDLGTRILENRKKLGLSQEELAEKLEVSRQTVSKWETGSMTPEISKLVKLSEIFNITLDELVKDNIKNGDGSTKPEIKKSFIEKIGKEKLKKFFKILIIIAVIFVIVFIARICIRKSIIEEFAEKYKLNFQTIGEKYSGHITENIEEYDNSGVYKKYRNFYQYFVNGDKRLVKITYYNEESSETGKQNMPEKEIYIDLNKLASGIGYKDVIEKDLINNTYKVINEYEFKSPIRECTDKLNFDLGIIAVYKIDSMKVATRFENKLMRNNKTNIIAWNVTDKNDRTLQTVINGDGAMSLFFKNYNADTVKQERKENLIYIQKLDKEVIEEEVTPNLDGFTLVEN